MMSPPAPSTVLRANAAYCIVCGVAMAIGAAALAEWSGAPVGVLVTLGIGLVGYGVAVVVVVASRSGPLVDIGRVAVIGDIGWLAVTALVIVATGWLTDAGEIALAVISVPVAVFAVAQTIGLRRHARSPGHRATDGFAAPDGPPGEGPSRRPAAGTRH